MRRLTGIRLASQVVRLGFYMGYAPPGTNPLELIALAQEAERLGYDSAWAAEAWGTDAVTVLTWLAATTSTIKIGSAIMQIPARTPEYVQIVRAALRRDALEFHGDQYDIPYSGDDATGLGKPLKLLVRPLRASIPIYLAALSPKNVRTAFEIADGWLPIYFSPERARVAFGYEPREGFDIAPAVNVVVSDDLEAARDMMRPLLALYIGGMGARGANFYNALFRRYGYEEEAERIQELYLEGKQREAIAAVPDALIDDVSLVGSPERIRDRLEAWGESGATTLLVATRDPTSLRTMAELAL